MATDYFLLIDGIEGESTDAKQAKSIKVDSWSWGATTANSAVDGAVARADVQDFNFVARTSKASPKLFEALVTGKHLATAKFTGRRAGGTQVDFLKINLIDVVVTSYQVAGNEQGATSIEQVSLDFVRVDMTYVPTDSSGKALSPVTTTYDRKTNKA